MRASVLRRLRALLKDRSGTYQLMQFVLVLPIFVLLLYGSFELMKLASIRQSLETGTYQAARYLSVYHKYYTHAQYNREDADDTWRARHLIEQSLLSNPYVSPDMPLQLEVSYFDGTGQPIWSPVDFDCAHIRDVLYSADPMHSELVFTIRTQLTIPWEASVFGLYPGDVTVTSSHTSFVDCGPWYPPPIPLTPTPTPTTAPTPTPTP